MNKLKEPILTQVRINKEDLEKLDYQANVMEMARSQLIRKLIKDYLKK